MVARSKSRWRRWWSEPMAKVVEVDGGHQI
ncbi:hypothetical protein A2U01_0114629, partial [Trifolium medium]|nr:hypothetical protein [Trifolium medium]